MAFSLSKLGNYIREVDIRNLGENIDNLLGVSINKQFMPSVANTIGTDLSNYKVISKNQFACSLMQVSRDGGIAVSLYKNQEKAIMSPAYYIFECVGEGVLSEYLELILTSTEFDREAVFMAVGGVRGTLTWEDFCEIPIFIPSLSVQAETIRKINSIDKKIETSLVLKNHIEEEMLTLFNNKFAPLSSDIEVGSPLSKLMSFGNGFAFKSDDYLPNGKYKIVTIKNVGDGYLDTSEVNYINAIDNKMEKNFKTSIGDILISLTGNVGRTALVNEENLLLNQRVAKIMPVNKNYMPFFYCLFRHNETKQYLINISSGTAQLNLSPVEVLETKIDYDESDIAVFSKQTFPMMNLYLLLSKEITLLTTYRRIISNLLLKEK